MRNRSASDLPEDIARFAQAQISAGRFSSIEDALRAGVEALEQRDATDAERARLLRAAWDEGQESLQRTAFLDECVTESSRV